MLKTTSKAILVS